MAIVLFLLAFFGPCTVAGIRWVRRAREYTGALTDTNSDLPMAAEEYRLALVPLARSMKLADGTRQPAQSGSPGDAIQRLYERERRAWRLVVLAMISSLPLVLAVSWAVNSLASTTGTTLDAAAVAIGLVLAMTVIAVVLVRFLVTAYLAGDRIRLAISSLCMAVFALVVVVLAQSLRL